VHWSYLFNLYLLSFTYLYLSPVLVLFIYLYLLFIDPICLFIYIIIWFNIEMKFMINKDLIIIVGGMTLGI